MTDYTLSKKASGEHDDNENSYCRVEQRCRHFSPDFDDDVFQPSPFRSRRSESPTKEGSCVALPSSTGRGYDEVHDITVTTPYTKIVQHRSHKRQRSLRRQTCRGIREEGISVRSPSVGRGNFDTVLEDLIRDKRGLVLIAFTGAGCSRTYTASTYVRKTGIISGYGVPSSNDFDMLIATKGNNSGEKSVDEPADNASDGGTM